MKTSNWKKWILGILAVVMVYIWYNAFQTMYPESTGLRVTTPKGVQSVGRSNAESLQYLPPKVNPFKQPTTTPRQSNRSAQPQRQPEAVTRLSPQSRLVGILREDKQSQAVIAQQDRSLVISIGDSLDTWQLLQINENSAVFGHGKHRDTLWLYTDD